MHEDISREEVHVLHELFAPLPDPVVLIDVLENKDPSILKNRAQLERFTRFVAGRHEQPGKPIPSPAT